MKRIGFISIVLIVFLISCFQSVIKTPLPVAAGDNPVKIIYNGDELHLEAYQKGAQATVINGITMVPLRAIAESLGIMVNWDENNRAVSLEAPKAIASIPDQDIFLYPFQKKAADYTGFILEVNGRRSYFDWKNYIEPAFAPALYHVDLNNDGKDEIVAIMTLDEGTGVLITEIHILNASDFTEIPLENPLDVIKSHVNAAFLDTSKSTILNINIDNKSYQNEFYYEKDHVLELPVFGNIINFAVDNNRISCSIPVQVTPAAFAGSIEILYGYDSQSKSFKAVQISYTEK